MKKSHVKLDVEGTWCNEWPKLRVTANQNIYWDDYVPGYKSIEFDMCLADTNYLRIQHYDKCFGHNGRWDTQSHNNVIVNDRAIKIKHIWLDQVELTQYLLQKWPMHTQEGKIFTDYLGFNGHIDIEFDNPVYDWIITELVIPKEQNKIVFDLVTETSFGDIFNYDKDSIELEEITELLNQYAHLLDQPAKIRNTSATT